MKKFTFIFAFVFFGFCAVSMAAEQRTIGTFGVWSAYVLEESDGKVCYMAAKPEKTEGKITKRGDVLVMITHRPTEGTKNVFSFMAGYGYKKGTQVDILIDGKVFGLFTQNDTGWAADTVADLALANAIKKGSKMIVKGLSSKGISTKDYFSLVGSTKAYEAISKACDIQ